MMIRKIINNVRMTYYDLKYSSLNLKGKKIKIESKLIIKNPQYISIGNNCYIGHSTRIEAWDSYNSIKYQPVISIGNNVKINSTCHIGAINNIVIGDDCLLGSHVMIIDHSHGKNDINEINIHPSNRNLYSKGDVSIGQKCWICENVVILPGVHIGNSVVVGANSVVTKDIPDYCVAVGNPAKIVKKISGNDFGGEK